MTSAILRAAPLPIGHADEHDHLTGLGVGRSVALLAVHHVRADGHVLTGGAEKYIRMVTCALIRSGARVHIGYSGDSIYDDLVEAHAPSHLTVENTGWLDDRLQGDRRLTISLLRDRRRWMRACGADTLFAVQQDHGASFLASLVAARSLGIRVVSTVRQSLPIITAFNRKRWFGVMPSPQLWQRRIRRRYRLPLRLSNAVIFNSRRIADSYGAEFGLSMDRIRVIHNGEPVSPPRDASISCRPVTIGTVGRITHAKGADILLTAFKTLSASDSRVRLVYFGDGPLLPELRSRTLQAGLADRIEFAGYGHCRETMYDAMDLYVHPSLRESMSNCVIEAMARGLPCIVTSVGGLPEAVEHGVSGLVVPPGCADSLAGAMASLVADPAMMQRLGAAARLRARQQFDPVQFELRTVKAILGL